MVCQPPLSQTQWPPLGSVSGGAALGSWNSLDFSSSSTDDFNSQFLPDSNGPQDFCSPNTPGPSPHYPQTPTTCSPGPQSHHGDESLYFHSQTFTDFSCCPRPSDNCPLTSGPGQTIPHLLLIQDQEQEGEVGAGGSAVLPRLRASLLGRPGQEEGDEHIGPGVERTHAFPRRRRPVGDMSEKGPRPSSGPDLSLHGNAGVRACPAQRGGSASGAGPGLYCSLTTRRQQLHHTHSESCCWRHLEAGVTITVTDGLIDFVAMETLIRETIEPRINVGQGFQAEVPPLRKYAHSNPQNALLLWTPWAELEEPTNQHRVKALLTMARSSVVPGGAASPDHALHVLSESRGDFLLTVEKLLSTSDSLTGVSWSAAETRLLVQSLQLHSKNFRRVQRAVQTKSLPQCVEFYYLWKKKLSLRVRTPTGPGLTVTLPDTNAPVCEGPGLRRPRSAKVPCLRRPRSTKAQVYQGPGLPRPRSTKAPVCEGPGLRRPQSTKAQVYHGPGLPRPRSTKAPVCEGPGLRRPRSAKGPVCEGSRSEKAQVYQGPERWEGSTLQLALSDDRATEHGVCLLHAGGCGGGPGGEGGLTGEQHLAQWDCKVMVRPLEVLGPWS
ncbi:putative transcriptional-regulating factor 1-like [Scophthalmus maximus]|uniref:Putative transcriptional-regulating factor 1-like n=1 Tax=Scophthalmus maximus TaxID=52904 RepID=A0A2U9AVA1_SCOMX|nr:putative transcriptional-regulating factor 1-like [Scophthalmus maximus]